MKLLDTLLPKWETRAFVCLVLTCSFYFGTPSTSYSQCDINIFQQGTLSNGSISLMPWLSYTSGCALEDDCGKTKELIVWDMEDLDPCEQTIPKSYIKNAMIDLSSSAKATDILFTHGYGSSKHALAVTKGKSARFKMSIKPEAGESGSISLLALNVKSVAADSELFCDLELDAKPDAVANYSITVLANGKQLYMGLKSVGTSWDQEIIDLDFISTSENTFDEHQALNLEVIIANFTTTGDATLAIDNLLFEGKECSFEDNLKYAWSTGETTERIYSAERGNYCVTVTDCNGCQAVDCINVN